MENFLNFIILPWWFSLPGYVANICPGIARALPGGKVPVSLNYLGPNKTWAALPAALMGASIVALLQSLTIYPSSYPQVSWWLLAICFGFGTVLGDWAKSLAKRLLGIEPGGKWWVEKIDFLVLSFLFLATAGIILPLHYYVIPIGFYFLVHGPGNQLAYTLGWRNSPH